MLEFIAYLTWSDAIPILILYLLMGRVITPIFGIIKDLNLIGRIFGRNRYVTKANAHEFNYNWVIHDFRLQKALVQERGRLESSIFAASTAKKYQWRLVLYPNGLPNRNSVHSSIFLMLVNSGDCTNFIGEFTFFYWNKRRERILWTIDAKSANRIILEGNYAWGVYDIITDDENRQPSTNLTITCQAKFAEDTFTGCSIKFEPIVPEQLLSSDLKHLFRDDEFSDVVLSVKGKEFRAHKNILSARSPVFAAMFRHGNLNENQQNKVDIVDIDEQVIEEMLTYIYSGHTKNLEELADDLLIAAEKYGLDGLKQMSEEILVKNLSVANVIDSLIFSDVHSAQKLKGNAINFIFENSSRVMKTNAWKEIASSHPHLLLEICEARPARK